MMDSIRIREHGILPNKVLAVRRALATCIMLEEKLIIRSESIYRVVTSGAARSLALPS